jgi:predicted ATPase
VAPSAPWHNLPTARTSFVGREKEIEEVKRLLPATRLLTLSGAGGSGKTRLALEVARELVGSYPDGAWLVELASLAEGALVPQAVAEVMEVPEQPNRPLTDVLVDALCSSKLLLVLDNCEHLIDGASRLVDTLLDSCPHLRVLATSREALGVTGEVVRPVPPLAVPGTRHPLTVEELERYESARLFTERALQRWSGFALTSENAWNVAEICRRLDGIPLAIELAAARAGVLSVEQIARRLDDCFRLLSAGSRMALPRHRTLQATIGWSHELLSEDERRLFRRLSVFADGFTLGAAEAVCSGENLEEDEVLGLLAHLVDKSLLVVREWGGEMRYQLLETVRQYGWEKLEESGEAKAIRQAHMNFFLTWSEEIGPKIEPKIKTADRRPWVERLEIEHDNLRAALRWAVDTGEAERSLRPAGALFWFWRMRGYLSEGRGWFERALTQVPAQTAARAKALYYAGNLAWNQGDYPVACSQLQESVEIWRKLEGRRDSLAHALWLLGLIMQARGEPALARSLAEESVEIFRAIGGDDFGLSMSLAILGIIVLNQEEYALATSLLEESAAVARKMGEDWFLSLPLRYLGAVAFRRGDYDRAAALHKESLIVLRESGEKWYISRSIECLASVKAMRGDHAWAARLFGAGEAQREATEASQVPFYMVDYDRGVAAAQTGLGKAAFEEAWDEGKAMTPEQAVEYALSEEVTPPLMIPAAEEPPADKPPDELTRREEEVTDLVARGLTNRQIAKELMLSKRTVDNHVRNILKKLTKDRYFLGIPAKSQLRIARYAALVRKSNPLGLRGKDG